MVLVWGRISTADLMRKSDVIVFIMFLTRQKYNIIKKIL